VLSLLRFVKRNPFRAGPLMAGSAGKLDIEKQKGEERISGSILLAANDRNASAADLAPVPIDGEAKKSRSGGPDGDPRLIGAGGGQPIVLASSECRSG